MASSAGIDIIIGADPSGLLSGLKGVEGAIDRFADQVEKALKGIDLKGGLRDLPGDLGDVGNRGGRRFRNAFKEALDPRNLAQGFAQGVGQQLTTLPLAAVTGGFNLVAGAVGSSLDKFKEFSGTIQRIGVLTGETGTADMAALKKEIESLGASTSKSATEVAQMAVELSAAGFTAKEQKEALRGIVMGSEATGESLKRVGEVGASTVRSFSQIGLTADSTGLKAADMVKVMDGLVATGNASATGIDDLGESLKYLAPTANANNQPLNGILTALGLLGNAGIKGSMAGTNLSEAITRMGTASAEGSKNMKFFGASVDELSQLKGVGGEDAKGFLALGVHIRDANGEMRPLMELLPEIKARLSSMSKEDAAIVSKQLFGAEGGRVMNTLLNATEADIAKMADTINQAGGSSLKAGQELQKGFGPALEQLGGAIETLQLKFGEALAPAVEGIARLLGDLFSRMGETGMFDQMGAAFQQLGQTLMELAGNDAVMDSLAQAISSVVTALAQMTGEGAVAFANWIQQMGPQIPGLAAGFQEFAMKAIELAQGLAPIAQAGLFLVGVVAQLGLTWGGFMNQIGLPVLQTVVTVLQAIGGAIGSVLQAVGGMLQGLAGVAGVVPGLSEALGGSAAALQRSGAAMQMFGGQMSTAQGAIQGAAGAAGNLATATQGATGSTTALGTAAQGAGKAAQGATGGLKAAAGGASSLSGAASQATSANQGLAGAAQGAAGAVNQQAGAANAAANANRGQAAALTQSAGAAATLAGNTQRAGDAATGASKGFSSSTVAILGMLGPLGQVAQAAASLWNILGSIMSFKPPAIPGGGGGGKPPAKPAAKPAKPRARAKGGPVWPGEAFLVGERGPELFVPPGSGYILTASETSGLLSAGVPGFAGGGRVRGREPIVVGENGPESFVDLGAAFGGFQDQSAQDLGAAFGGVRGRSPRQSRYRQLQAELKSLRSRGSRVPRLTSDQSVLESALAELKGQSAPSSERPGRPRRQSGARPGRPRRQSGARADRPRRQSANNRAANPSGAARGLGAAFGGFQDRSVKDLGAAFGGFRDQPATDLGAAVGGFREQVAAGLGDAFGKADPQKLEAAKDSTELGKEVDRVIAAIDALAVSLSQSDAQKAANSKAFEDLSAKAGAPIDRATFDRTLAEVTQLQGRGASADQLGTAATRASQAGIDVRSLGVKLSEDVAKQVEANLAKVAQAAQEKTATGLGATAGKVDKGTIDQTKAAEDLGAKFDSLAEEVRALANSPRELVVNGSMAPAADAAKLMEKMQVLASAGVRR